MTTFKERAAAIGDGVVSVIGQSIVSVAITVFLILSGLAARTGVQSLLMLAISTGLLAAKQKPDGKWMARAASFACLVGAVALAFLVPRGATYAYPVTLGIGGGTWLLIGIVLLIRGTPGENPFRRRPDAWAWIVGGVVWVAISLTYRNTALVVALGKLSSYLWLPWSLLAFVVTGLILPRAISRRWPALLPTTGRWAGGLARSVLLGLATSAAVAFFVVHASPLVSADIVQAQPCGTCPPETFVAALQVTTSSEGEVVLAHFGAAPDGFLLHIQGADAPLELRQQDGGWFVLGNGTAIDPTTLSVRSDGDTVIVLLQDPALWRPVAVEGIGGNRLPPQGYDAPDQADV